jgi:hypothetical protein
LITGIIFGDECNPVTNLKNFVVTYNKYKFVCYIFILLLYYINKCKFNTRKTWKIWNGGTVIVPIRTDISQLNDVSMKWQGQLWNQFSSEEDAALLYQFRKLRYL